MGDPKIVAELLDSAKTSLARGFSILTVKPHSKDPFVDYSPHAVKSATRDPLIALRAWENGEEANHGVACGLSNITVVDCDHGLNNIEEFEAWRTEHGLPETFTVISGRDGFGAHMYYSGAVPTVGFKIGNVTGELKGKGGYVVGPGSVHPSGKKYTLLKDVNIAPLPPGLATFAAEKTKNSGEFKKAEDDGELIPAGNRWIHGQKIVGQLRNMGYDEEGIYEGLKRWYATKCEDGANYPDEKVREQAHAAFNKFDAMEATPVVFLGGDKKMETAVGELPLLAAEGDWIGDLAHLLSDGTFIPLSFARMQIKTILAASVNGLVGFPNQPDLHMKHWSMLISSQPESGKGMSWKRTAEMALANYISKSALGLPKAGYFSSGEHMIKYLSDPDAGFEGKNVLVYFDELKTLFEKGGSQNSTLFSKLIELYDREDGSAGSLSHSGGEFKNISMSLTGGFTTSSFESAITGKGAGGDGFLSRCVLAYTGDVKHVGDWPELETMKVNEIAAKMLKRFSDITAHFLDTQNADQSEEKDLIKYRFVPVESPGAKALRDGFQTWLVAKRKEHNEKHPEQGYMSRIESHFKRDLLMRTLFSEDPKVITEDQVKRSIEWAKHELYLREELWPIDKGGPVELMEKRIIRALDRHEHLTKIELQRFCNLKRAGTGGVGTFNMAWKNLLQGDVLVVVGKTHKGTEKFGMREGF
jgi:hypothetical protein